jgi:hypothetical protein
MSQWSIIHEIKSPSKTFGGLYLFDFRICEVLEDTVRAPGVKIPGQTAIGYGEYDLTIDFSNRFQRMMPHILNVPMFDGIRIHKGMTDKDTEGCPLVGMKRNGFDGISNCAPAFDYFFARLEAMISAKLRVRITIKDAPDVKLIAA